MAGKAGPDINEFGLVGYWDAANVKSYPGSGTIWRDLSGNGNHGTLSTGSIGTVSGSGVMVFTSASADYINCGNNSTLNIINSISVESWIKIANTPLTSAVILSKGNVDGGVSTIQYNLHLNTSRSIKFQISDGSSGNTITTTDVVSLNTWTHVVAVLDIDNTMSYVYINGNLSKNQSSLSSLGGTAINLYIGQDKYTNRYFFNGEISNVKIYNHALSQSEITQNYNAMKSRFQ